ncbi:hypothetical protein L0Y46_01850, partial [bacterium]|nr:hypothetical protein [bacterium]
MSYKARIPLKTFYFFGKQGELVQFTGGKLSDWPVFGLEASGKLNAAGAYRDNFFTPLLEIPDSRPSVHAILTVGRDDFAGLVEAVKRVYQTYLGGRFSQYGEIVSISLVSKTEADEMWVVNYIARRSLVKPTLAADFIPFVQDDDGSIFFVGIIRREDPGAGTVALIGGRQDVIGAHLETPLEAAIREGEEESGIIIRLLDREKLPIFADSVEVEVSFTGFSEIAAHLYLVGTEETGETEIINGERRVHQATAYSCLISVPGVQTEESVKALFRAGDDAKDIFV